MSKFSIFCLFAAAGLLAACSPAPAEPDAITKGEWTLDGAASQLSYVSIKAGEIAEVNAFKNLTGSVTSEGAASVTIDLASVSTGVDIRDERMREVFFDVANNPAAEVSAVLDPAPFETLSVGASSASTIEGTVTLKGAEAPFTANVTVTRVGADRVLAVTDAPVILQAGDFGLTDGLAELQELAGLPSISPAVPVTFSLTFER